MERLRKMKSKKIWFVLGTVFATVLFGLGICTEAKADGKNYSYYSGGNIGNEDYSEGYWASTVKSYLTTCSDGTLMRVDANEYSDGILVEYYDSSYSLKKTITVSEELPIFGAFYETDSNYYILTGQENEKESDAVEVLRLTKYDKNWTRISDCKMYGSNTTVPFEGGSVRMTNVGKYILIRTCHEMYAIDGVNHQANWTIEIDTETMETTDGYSGVGYWKWGYVSHSFNQFIKVENGNIVSVDQGDGSPRSVVLLKYPTDASDGTFTLNGLTETCEKIDIMEFEGSYGANYTGASIGGFEISSSSYLVVGNTDIGELGSDKRNVWLASVNKETSEVTMHWLTQDGTEASYSGSGEYSACTPMLISYGNDRYAIIWERQEYSWGGDAVGTLCYVFCDGDGNLLSDIYEEDGWLSDCQPMISGNKAIWYVTFSNQSGENSVYFYTLDSKGNLECYGDEIPQLLSVKNLWGKLKLEWTAVEGADGYLIAEMYEDGGCTVRKVEADDITSVTDKNYGKVNSYIDTCADGVTHTFFVSACNGKCSSLYSDGFSISGWSSKTPELENTAGGVSISWDEMQNADSYDIYRKKSSDTDFAKVATVTEASWTDTTVSSGIMYDYKVLARSSEGISVESDVQQIVYLAVPVIEDIYLTDGGIAFVWKEIEGATNYAFNYQGDSTWEGRTTVKSKGEKYLTWVMKDGFFSEDGVSVDDEMTVSVTVYYYADSGYSSSNESEEKKIIRTELPTSGSLTGLRKVDGKWCYCLDGNVDTSYTGLAKNKYGWWYVKNGYLDTGYTGMAKNSYGWWYVSSGKLDRSYTGMAKNSYGWWYMTNGKLDKSYSGIATNTAGSCYYKNGKLDTSYTGMYKNGKTWVYISKGKLSTTYTGMARNKYGWWYIKNGKLDTTYTGMAKNSSGWWYMTNGKLDTTYTGMARNSNGWWYMTNGKLDTTYTGMAKNSSGWWYMTNGKLSTTYTGMAKNKYGWWYIKNGKLDTTYTGMAKNSSGWWYIKNGKLDTTYTGMAKNKYGWWYMTNGKLDTTYTGMAKNSYGWWYMTNGRLDTTYTGIATNKYGSWYMKNGKLQSKYSGKVNVNGKTYTIKNGKVV